MRTKIAAGNWKMNTDPASAKALVSGVLEGYAGYEGAGEVIFTPPFPFLAMVAELIGDTKGVHLAAQNVHQEEKGAYTGETSVSILTSVGVSHVLIGHSERREYFHEDNALLAAKVDRALAGGLVPVFCIGETLEQREGGKMLDVIRTQVSEGVFHLDAGAFSQVIVAYEPIWAIGTGVTASPEQAQEVHQFIRSLIAEQYDETVADDTSILYGGSVKPGNANELFGQPDIDGGLVGGASLKADDFVAIINALD